VTATRVRPARPDDAPALAPLTTQLGYPVEAPEQAERLARVLASTDDAVLVAVDAADTAIGWIHVQLRHPLTSAPHAQIAGMVVNEEHRSEGVGAALLAAAEAWAGERGLTSVQVYSRVERERAHRFYERHGYGLEKTSRVLRHRIG
jgi:GNAT superfamily N-acetyltransferase